MLWKSAWILAWIFKATFLSLRPKGNTLITQTIFFTKCFKCFPHAFHNVFHTFFTTLFTTLLTTFFTRFSRRVFHTVFHIVFTRFSRRVFHSVFHTVFHKALHDVSQYLFPELRSRFVIPITFRTCSRRVSECVSLLTAMCFSQQCSPQPSHFLHASANFVFHST